MPSKARRRTGREAAVEGLSDRSRWLRFFSAFPDLAQAARWATKTDNDRRYGLVATVDDHGQIVGHAGFERESEHPERAEVASAGGLLAGSLAVAARLLPDSLATGDESKRPGPGIRPDLHR